MPTGAIEVNSHGIMVSCWRCGFLEILPAGSRYCLEVMQIKRHLCLNCDTFQSMEVKGTPTFNPGAERLRNSSGWSTISTPGLG
jgi:hypothetical protein